MPELWIHDGTAPRKARELYYHDGAAARKVREAWYHDGTAPRRVYSSAGVVEPLPTINATRADTGAGTSTATITWGADGSIAATGRTASGWYDPIQSGIGSAYHLRVTKVSGTTPTGLTLGSWLPLSTARSATLSVSGSNVSAQCSLTYEISADAGATTIDSSSASIFVERAA